LKNIQIVTYKNESELLEQKKELEKNTPGVNIFYTGQKTSAAINHNYGIENTDDDIIVSMDDDLFGFFPGWLEELIKPLEDENVKLVGARLFDKHGKIQPTSSGSNNLNDDYVDVTKQHLPATCIAFRRKDIGDDVRFDEKFIGSGWDDTDFCEQLKAKFPKGKLVINNKVKLIHANEMKEQGDNWITNRDLFFSKWKHLKQATSVMVGTPAYGGNFQMNYVEMTIGIVNTHIPWTPYYIKNESLISRARNTILSVFYHNKQWDKLLFLDADTSISPDDFAKLVNTKHDVVGAAVRLKSKDQIFNITKILKEVDTQYFTVEHIGTAVLCLSRKAVNALVDHAKKNGDVYTKGVSGADGMEYYDVFKTGVKDDMYLSEDYWACMQLRELGFDIHVDNTILTSHAGNVAFSTIPAESNKPIDDKV